MVTLSQSFVEALAVKVYLPKALAKAGAETIPQGSTFCYCRREAPDPAIPLGIRYGNEIVHSSMKIGG